MFREAAQAEPVVGAQLDANAATVSRLAKRLRDAPPRAVVTLRARKLRSRRDLSPST